MLKLPVGIQSFEVIRTDGYYYVDKTRFVRKLVDEGKYYFLSRPRRFGKSLFLDTLRQAFLGKRELFEGLYLEGNWDWEARYPVLYISFGAGVHRNVDELLQTQEEILDSHARRYGIGLSRPSIKGRFMEMIEQLAEGSGRRVVVLVDEYDKPILDNIERPGVAADIRESLKNFYSVLKDADPYLKFCMLTGVTKFSKVSLFSGLNNLKDVTIHPGYGTICGYTQEDLERVFPDRLGGVDLDAVRHWYNGYSWLGEPVYNPFDVLLFLDTREFRPYWFETGTPTFLIRLLMERNYFVPRLEDLEAGEELIESFELDSIKPETLLFQAGYLTIRDVKRLLGHKRAYGLRYPNLEVKSAFSEHLLTYFVQDVHVKTENEIRMARLLEAGDVEGLMGVFKSFFASIPHDWYRKNELSGYEGYYASIFYCYFAALGVDVLVEDATSHGRLDMAVMFNGCCYLFEFKVVELEPGGRAMEQLEARRYHEKYIGKCAMIYLIGVEFSKKERNIVGFEVREVIKGS